MMNLSIRREDILDLPMLTSGELIAQIDLATVTYDESPAARRERINIIADLLADRGGRGCTIAQSWFA